MKSITDVMGMTAGLVAVAILLGNPLAVEQLLWAQSTAAIEVLEALMLSRRRARWRRRRRRALRRLALLARMLRELWRRDRRQARIALGLALMRWPA